MNKFKTWDEVRKNFEFTDEEEREMELEKQIIAATIKAREEKHMTQTELSKRTGLKQSAIARIEGGKHLPNISTLLKILEPLGYTLKVVPIRNKKKL